MKRLLLLLLLLPVCIFGVKVQVSVNKYTISTNDRLTISLKISDSSPISVSEPAPPVIKLFSFRNMTNSSSSSINLIGMKKIAEYSSTYNYIFIPTQVGSTTIPSISVRVNNRKYQTKPIAISVVKGSSSGNSQSQSSPAFPTPDPFGFNDFDSWDRTRVMDGNTMLVALPDRQFVYRGFPAIVSYYLYTDEMVRSFNLDDEKDFEGYGKSTYEQPTMLNYEDVRHNGKNYKRALIKRLAIMPNMEGTLQAPQMQGVARLYNFGYLNKSLASTGGSIVVRPLPKSGVPAGFSGAVGNFKISHSLSKTEVALGEAISFSLKIQGRGNFNQFSSPMFASGSGFQVSSPVVMDNLNAGIEGTRTYYYTLIPQSRGQLKMPELPFAWFDNDAGEYRQYTIPLQQIEVKAANVLSYLNRMWEPQAPRSMHPKISRKHYPNYVAYASQVWYWILVAFVLACCIGISVMAYNARLQRKSPQLYAKKQARKVMQKYMKQATAAAQSLSPEFYPIAEKALFNYLSTRYAIAGHLSTTEKLDALAMRNLPLELLQDLNSFVTHCQEARYMPEADRAINLQQDLQMLQGIVASFSRLHYKNGSTGE